MQLQLLRNVDHLLIILFRKDFWLVSRICCCCWFYFDAKFCVLAQTSLLEDRNAWDVCPVVVWSYVSLVLIDEMWCVGTSGVYSYNSLFSIFYFYNCYCFFYFDLTSNFIFILRILHIYYIIEAKKNMGKLFLNLNFCQ